MGEKSVADKMDETDRGGKSGGARPSRRGDPVVTGMAVATGTLVALFAIGYFAVWFEAELPWMTPEGMAVLCWAYVAVLFVGWPLAVRHARAQRRCEEAENIGHSREALAARGVRVKRLTGHGRGNRMALDLPNVRDYRHMPWTNGNVKSENRP